MHRLTTIKKTANACVTIRNVYTVDHSSVSKMLVHRILLPLWVCMCLVDGAKKWFVLHFVFIYFCSGFVVAVVVGYRLLRALSLCDFFQWYIFACCCKSELLTYQLVSSCRAYRTRNAIVWRGTEERNDRTPSWMESKINRQSNKRWHGLGKHLL